MSELLTITLTRCLITCLRNSFSQHLSYTRIRNKSRTLKIQHGEWSSYLRAIWLVGNRLQVNMTETFRTERNYWLVFLITYFHNTLILLLKIIILDIKVMVLLFWLLPFFLNEFKVLWGRYMKSDILKNI